MLIILFIFYIPPVFLINGLRHDIGHDECPLLTEIIVHITIGFELLTYGTPAQLYKYHHLYGLVLQVGYPCSIYIVVR